MTDFDKFLDPEIKDCYPDCLAHGGGPCNCAELDQDFADTVAEMKADYVRENY